MKFQGFVVLAYGIFLLVGGMIGYYKAHSVPSLISGSASAALVLASAIGMFNGYKAGYYSSIALTALLLAFFSYRFSLTMNFIPAGLSALLSLGVLLVLLVAYFKKV